ncbi:hypothetical protein CR513_22747, partial [Mucuna pruriens]
MVAFHTVDYQMADSDMATDIHLLLQHSLAGQIRCIPESEIKSVLHFCHSMIEGGHYGSIRMARKVLDCGLYKPSIFRDVHKFVSTCE